MAELIVDGESGIVASEKCQTFLQRLGVKLHTRAKDQHARYVERRGELLRQVVRKIYSQLKHEEMADAPFASVLAEATFAGNALLEVGGSSPYNAVYGRVPSILPGIDRSPDSSGLRSNQLLDSHRLREISITSMIHGSAAARIGRALNTRTTQAAPTYELRVGCEVDFYREPSAKDTSG